MTRTTADQEDGRPSPAAPGRPSRPLVGVVGGMGPLASTELLRTVYRSCAGQAEQDAPRVLLWSDPAVVDRTEAIDRGELGLLRRSVETAVRGLVTAGAERVVIACVTAHHILDDLPPELAKRCVSLVDVIHEELGRATEPHLLLCTKGTARAGVLTTGPRAAESAHRLVLLEPDDQEALHREVYRIKRGDDPAAAIGFLSTTLPRYGVNAYIAACTELHLVTRAIEESGRSDDFPAIDPLTVVARRITNGEL
ncbi:aspartate/glutamate racemase family protein [Streptomyces europaeiscabiei]|uniref:Aspartate/glutamate racemase family protein n=1 Tax=Streptomyces europaeiscabiei TaxID=146819 RepID=A0AAJ2PJ93_9ACTN|nr:MULTISPECIES: aspartate/glutamate racemase family protein [Streptomyces]MDX3128258.1 aspartate/glutamate racemase family protein [Streptomyces europaeiscabiei]